MKRTLLLLMLLSFSALTYADTWPGTKTCAVKLQQPFSVEAEYEVAAGNAAIYLKKQGNKAYRYPLWTAWNDINGFEKGIFHEQSLESNHNYIVRIEFNHVRKSGNSYTADLTYLLYRSGVLIKEEVATDKTFSKMSDSSDVLFDMGNGLISLDCAPGGRPTTIPDNVCELFPSAAQTWTGNSNALLEMSNNTRIIGAKAHNKQRYVGFPQSAIDIRNEASCDGQSCLGDSGLMVTKPDLGSFKSPDDPNLNKISVWGGHREFSNNEVIGTLSVGNGSVTFKTGTYWIDSIDINNAGVIEIPKGDKVTIHTKNLTISNDNSKFIELEGAELVVFVHDSISGQVVLSQNAEFMGLLYSEKDVSLSNSSVLNGAITAKTIHMSRSAKIIATNNHCVIPSDDYEITLSPATQYALMCGTDQPSFEIQTTNDNNAASTGVTVQASPDADNFSIDVVDSTGTGSYPSFTTSNLSSRLGKLKLQVTVTDQSGIDL